MKYSDIHLELALEPTKINAIYDKVIATGPNSFSSFDEYSKTYELLVTTYIGYDDYLHSNNLIQIFRLNIVGNTDLIPSWFKYYSLIIHSKRSIKYYLDNPKIFWGAIKELAVLPDYVERIDNALVGILEFYKEEYSKYPKFLKESLNKFVRYYQISIGKYSEPVSAHISEIKQLLQGKEYSELESRNIVDAEETLEENNVALNSPAARNFIEKQEEIHDKYYGDIALSDEDSRKKILVVGGDNLLKRPDVIWGIGKKYNINKDQFEIYNDYDALTNQGNELVKKVQYHEDKYIGVIFGSVPHSTNGNAGYSSLITRFQQDEFFPTTIKCESNTSGARLKLTKTSFTNALRDLIIKYLMKKN